MNDDREPAKIASKNPFAVKNGEFDTEPASSKGFAIDSRKGPC